MKIAFLYTGQGFQKPGMIHELPDCFYTKKYLKAAEEILGRRIDMLDASSAISSNENTQICIYLCESVWSRILKEKWQCDIVSGHSIGSFAAAVESGVLNFEKGLQLVSLRGRYMEQLFSSGYGMTAISGLTESQVKRVLMTFYDKNPEAVVFLATVNEETQCTVSGRLDWLNEFKQYVQKDYPVKLIPLQVKVPSHCSLMDPVTKILEDECDRLDFGEMRVPYICNSRGRRAWKASDVKKDLIEGVSRTVRWYDGITLMKEIGIDTFIEVGTAHTLTDIGRMTYPELRWIGSQSAMKK